MSTTSKNNIKTMSKNNLTRQCHKITQKSNVKNFFCQIISISKVHKVREVHKENKYHFMPCQFEFLEARLALQVGSELKNRENRGSFNHFNYNYVSFIP